MKNGQFADINKKKFWTISSLFLHLSKPLKREEGFMHVFDAK